jgi:hypothetical protein
MIEQPSRIGNVSIGAYGEGRDPKADCHHIRDIGESRQNRLRMSGGEKRSGCHGVPNEESGLGVDPRPGVELPGQTPGHLGVDKLQRLGLAFEFLRRHGESIGLYRGAPDQELIARGSFLLLL